MQYSTPEINTEKQTKDGYDNPSDFVKDLGRFNPRNNRPIIRIGVIGVGGGGCNAVCSMKKANIKAAEFIAINTDLQALYNCATSVDSCWQIGRDITKGYGAGSDSSLGEAAARENAPVIKDIVKNFDLVFITAGMGGGTGTGAAPVIAEIARQQDILTVAVVTEPFDFEGDYKKEVARRGIAKLRKAADSMIIIPNQNLINQVHGEALGIERSFELSDRVLRQAIQGITDVIVKPQKINVDFNDVKAVLRGGGNVHIGMGRGSGSEHAVEDALKQASHNPITGTDIKGASRIIACFSAKQNITFPEVNAAMSTINSVADKDVKWKTGLDINSSQEPDIIVTIIASDFKEEQPPQRPQEDPHAPVTETSYRQSDRMSVEPARSSADAGVNDRAPQNNQEPRRAPDRSGHIDIDSSDYPAWREKLKNFRK